MNNFEKMGTDPAEANKQLQGFEIKGDAESLESEYADLFEGDIESESLDKLFEEFGEILKDMPEEILEEVRDGNTESIEKRAKNEWGWKGKKIMQFVVFVALSFYTPFAHGQGKDEALHDLPTVSAADNYARMGVSSQNKLGLSSKLLRMGTVKAIKGRTPTKITVSGGVVVSPNKISRDQFEGDYKEYQNIRINGGPARIIYSDANRVVLGGEGSVYKNDGDGEVAIGTVIIE